MDLAECLFGLIGGTHIGCTIGDIQLHADDSRIARRKLSQRDIDGVLANIRDNHTHAGAREHSRHAETHAAGTARNERHRTFNIFHRLPQVISPFGQIRLSA